MSKACPVEDPGGAAREAAALRATDWLGLAAAPTFAVMALLTSLLDNGGADIFCAAAQSSPLNGMTLMYGLMSVFHSAPWVRLASSR